MENNLYCYKDNILNKLEKNKEIKELRNYISENHKWDDELNLSIGFLTPKFKIKREILLLTLDSLIEYNNKMIDKYLKLSAGIYEFGKEEKSSDTECNAGLPKESIDGCSNGERTES